MKVLHLFSNYKWTGPAEPALNLCVALRRLGIEADFACCSGSRSAPNKVAETARDRGIEPILDFYLAKHAHPLKNAWDRMALTRFIKRHGYDLLHCHMDNDHRIAIEPAQKLGLPLIRSSYAGEGLCGRARYRRLLATPTAWLIEPSRKALEHDAATYGFLRSRMRVIPGAVDTERFDPARQVPDGRQWLGIPREAFVVGIVARLQRHRRFEDFFEAIRELVGRHPNVHAIVVGRGTRQEEVAQKPARERGLEGHVHFPGYLEGEEYVGVVKAFDVKVFLVPGTDGTCRAVREAMALAKPVVAADRGMLAELIADGEDGFVCDGSPGALCQALHQLCTDGALTRRLGQAARKKALATFSLEVQARAMTALYESVLEMAEREPYFAGGGGEGI